MRVYTVHQGPAEGPEQAVLVKEGFCWPALFLGPIWAAWYGLWLWAALLLAAQALLFALGEWWPRGADLLAVVEMAIAVLFAAEANEFRRHALAPRGRRQTGVVGGADLDTAHRRLVDLSAIALR